MFSISVSSVIAVARTLIKLCSIIVVGVDILDLLLILEGILSVFNQREECLLWVDFIWPYYIEVGSLCVDFQRVLIINLC